MTKHFNLSVFTSTSDEQCRNCRRFGYNPLKSMPVFYLFWWCSARPSSLLACFSVFLLEVWFNASGCVLLRFSLNSGDSLVQWRQASLQLFGHTVIKMYWLSCLYVSDTGVCHPLLKLKVSSLTSKSLFHLKSSVLECRDKMATILSWSVLMLSDCTVHCQTRSVWRKAAQMT